MNRNRHVIEDIVSEHADEVADLWLIRNIAANEPHYSLEDLADIDGRLEANLDGLRVGESCGWEICKEKLASKERGEVFAAGVLAIEGKEPDRLQAVLDVVQAAPEVSRALISAFGWLPVEKIAGSMAKLLRGTPWQRGIGIRAAAVHRHDPGRPLLDALTDEDPFLRAQGYRAVGELGRTEYVYGLMRNPSGADSSCLFWGTWSAALLGHEKSRKALCELAARRGPYQERAAALGFRTVGTSKGAQGIWRILRDPSCMRIAVTAVGALGDPRWIPWLIEQMAVPELARAAGEAFTMITGANLELDQLEKEPPGDLEEKPTENPEDEEVGMDPDEDLPWPDPKRVEEWWAAHKKEFSEETRHLLGKPITQEWLGEVLREGQQRQRAAAALELALLNPGEPLFEVRAPGLRQQQALGLK